MMEDTEGNQKSEMEQGFALWMIYFPVEFGFTW